MTFSPVWLLLQQEGYLAHSCLCTGLTALRNANVGGKKGLYYSAFFQLSNGFERMMKLVLILDHIAKNDGKKPDQNKIRRFGHDLLALLKECQDIANIHVSIDLKKLSGDASILGLMGFLDSFAHQSGRYANINGLSVGPQGMSVDPLARWSSFADEIFEKFATTREKHSVSKIRATAFTQNISSLNTICDLSGNQLSVSELSSLTRKLDIAGAYAIRQLIKLIEALRELVGAVTTTAQESVCKQRAGGNTSIPHMKEFFDFAWSDKSVLKKKKWP